MKTHRIIHSQIIRSALLAFLLLLASNSKASLMSYNEAERFLLDLGNPNLTLINGQLSYIGDPAGATQVLSVTHIDHVPPGVSLKTSGFGDTLTCLVNIAVGTSAAPVYAAVSRGYAHAPVNCNSISEILNDLSSRKVPNTANTLILMIFTFATLALLKRKLTP